MLVPLQTLFGWPAAPDPSALAELGLLIGLPVAVIIIAFAVAKIGNAAKDRRTGGGVQATDPIWMGGRAKSIMGGPENELTGVAEAEREQLEAAPTEQEKEERSQARSEDPQIVGNYNPEPDSDGSDANSETSSSGASTGGAGARW